MMIKLPAVTVRVIAGAAPVVRYRSTPKGVALPPLLLID
jgi:hypothetical protein